MREVRRDREGWVENSKGKMTKGKKEGKQREEVGRTGGEWRRKDRRRKDRKEEG